MAHMDCTICASAKGLKDRQELVEHMAIHRDNPDLMIEKIADYIAARETSREVAITIIITHNSEKLMYKNGMKGIANWPQARKPSQLASRGYSSHC
jgi:hypothetical protein